MQDEKKKILVLGMTGTGKSTLIRELIKDKKRLIVYDTLGEYTEGGAVVYDYATLCQALTKLHDKTFRIIFQPLNPCREFSAVCDIIYSIGNICFAVEEIDTFLCLNASGLDDNFLNIVQRGRHNDIELIGVTQRPFTIPAILRSQCKALYTFRQFEQRDIDWIKGMIGAEAEKVRDLKNFEYLHYENGAITYGKTKAGIDTGDNLRVRETLPVVPEQETKNEVLPQENKSAA
jgi:hypothetical protein